MKYKILLNCDHCGKEFERRKCEVKAKKKTGCVHKFCSRECAYASPLRSETIRRKQISRREKPVINLSPLDIGYLAGIIDGEGSFVISPGVRSKNTSLTVNMCDKPVLEHIGEITGIGTINKTPYRSGQTNTLWRWGVYSKVDLSVFLPIIIPAFIGKSHRLN